MQPRYEFFDHTADVGVRVFAPTLAALIEPAGRGLYAVVGEIKGTGEPGRQEFVFPGDDPALLLRDYLAELLRLFAVQGRFVTGVEVAEFGPARLAVSVDVRTVDMTRSNLEREVKAITYHALSIRPIPGGFVAVFVVDI